jgi:phosphatidate cytidylyltransferase
MDFFTVLQNPVFWAYTVTAAVLLAAAWVLLIVLQRWGRVPERARRVFWTWVVLCVLVTVAVLPGREVFALMVTLIALFACKEFARATGLYDDWIFTGLVYLAILTVNLVALWPGYDAFMASPIYAVAALCLLPVLRNRPEGMLQHVALSVMAFVYFGYFLAHLSLLYAAVAPHADHSPHVAARLGYLYFVIYGTATADLAGWLAGRRFGRHPLAAHLSPEMTWERIGGALAWGLVWSFTLGWTLPQPQFSWPALLLSALLFGIMGPLGELVMRYILRDLGLKEAAERPEFLPYLTLGHLNRLIFVAPLFFRLVHWFDTELFPRPPTP